MNPVAPENAQTLVADAFFPIECKITHIPIKRTFDILFSLLVLIIGIPLFLLITLGIRFSSRGPIIYSHERMGRGGKKFRCYKFRSMYLDADERLKKLLKKEPSIAEEWKNNQKIKKDPRITLLGHFLRKTSLDELPQFWNVLRGDLSVVGPRPVIESEIKQFFGHKAHKILSVRPGITGLWQTSGRNNLTYNTRIKLDEYYVDHRSFNLDMKLIAKTIPIVLLTKGAY